MALSQDEKFERIVDLVTHACEELVDDPDVLTVTSSHSGNTGSIEICGPENEIGKIFGSKRRTLMSINHLAYSVASKYGFRVLLNVLNETEAGEYRGDRRPRSTEDELPLDK